MIVCKLNIDNFPISCCDCPIFEYDRDDYIGFCSVINKVLDDNDMYHKRDKDCPLVKRVIK